LSVDQQVKNQKDTDQCSSCSDRLHPNHKAELSRLRRISGQLSGIERMIKEGRYCPDILVQTRAVSAAVRSLESALLERHIKHCVQQAFQSDDESEREVKVGELIEIFSKRLDR
jgi:DNA-binding FrmR family transcriptional regulator